MTSFFNLSSCPSGWTEATSARGRYIVGLPSGGWLAGTAGTALSNLENRSVGQHSHTISVPDQNVAIASGGTQRGGQTWVSANTALTGSVAGTNAPYIQYLVCQKN